MQPDSKPDERLPLLDVARGLAVLGILAMNISGFAYEEWRVLEQIERGGSDLAILWTRELCFDGRMRAIFSVLFGAGVWLAITRAEARGEGLEAADRHTRRMLWLLLFGLIHGYLLLWPGDILYRYALCGLVLLPFRRLRPRGLVLAGGFLLGIATLFGLSEVGQGRAAWERLQRAEASGVELEAAREEWAGVVDWREPHPLFVAQMRDGYAAAFWALAPMTFDAQTRGAWRGGLFDALGAMLIGMALVASGYFHGRWRRSWHVGLIALGYGAVAPAAAALAQGWFATGGSATAFDNELLYNLTYHPFRILTGLAHLSVLALLWGSGLAPRACTLLACAGRLALTHYVTHTLVALLVFVVPGRQYDRWTLTQASGLVLGIWAFQLAVGPLWLRSFRQGPLEWLWRSLVAWQRLPFRRRAGVG